jgi:uncharacterized protein (DUF1697 family)
MPQYVALLRAINVGGRTVAMARLRELFAGLGCARVDTFIASGNVIFDSRARQPARLERQIEQHLLAALGYPVATFIRVPAELGPIAAYQPFPDRAARDTLYVAFLRAAPPPAAMASVLAQQTRVDALHFRGRELYWLRRAGAGESTFSGAVLEKLLGAPATVRNANTIQRLAARFSGSGSQAA